MARSVDATRQRTSPHCFIRVSGGFGNQLFQYAFARSLKLNHGIDAALDVSAYSCPRHSSVAHQRLSLETMGLPITFVRLPKWRYELARRMHTLPSAMQRAVTGIEFRKERAQPQLGDKQRWRNIVVNGAWQSEAWFRDVADVVCQELRAALGLADLEPERGAISFHVRRGDYLNVGYMALLDYPELLKQAREHFRSIGHGNWTFHVFSDDPDWCRDNLKGSDVVVREAGTMRDDFRDMSRCEHNVIANSSFSWWAAYLNANPDKVVCVPGRWRSDADAEDIGIVADGFVVLKSPPVPAA